MICQMDEEKKHALTAQDVVLTEQERNVLEHTLTGQTGANRSREAYRNFYAAGKGHHAMPQLESLVARGLMKVGVKYGDDGNYYQCTESGATAVGIALPLYCSARRRVMPASTTENKIGADVIAGEEPPTGDPK